MAVENFKSKQSGERRADLFLENPLPMLICLILSSFSRIFYSNGGVTNVDGGCKFDLSPLSEDP